MQVQTAIQAGKFPGRCLRFAKDPARQAPTGMQIVLGKGEELFGEGDEAEFFFYVVSGAIRT